MLAILISHHSWHPIPRLVQSFVHHNPQTSSSHTLGAVEDVSRKVLPLHQLPAHLPTQANLQLPDRRRWLDMSILERREARDSQVHEPSILRQVLPSQGPKDCVALESKRKSSCGAFQNRTNECRGYFPRENEIGDGDGDGYLGFA